jgi:hypothetical protein
MKLKGWNGEVMPCIVDKVENPWEPYMDGNIWRFTPDEIMSMPDYRPMTSQMSNEVLGKVKYTWYMDKTYYVRFVDANDTRSPEELAGWK